MVEIKLIYYIMMLIYYFLGKLYIGNLYMIIVCDILVCYKCVMGYDVYFLIGMDEYGFKIEEKVEKLNIDLKLYVDGMVK